MTQTSVEALSLRHCTRANVRNHLQVYFSNNACSEQFELHKGTLYGSGIHLNAFTERALLLSLQKF